MKDINLSQFVNRFLNFDFAKKSQGNIENLNFRNLPNLIPEAQRQEFVKLPTPRVNVSSQNPTSNIHLAQLNNGDKTILLKELLNLPKDLQDFFLMMTSSALAQTTNAKNLPNALNTVKIDVAQLLAFIQDNGKEAVAKLFQMVANFNQMGTSIKTSQLNELTTLINACISASDDKQQQALKNFLLLYLPWLPLEESPAFKLEIKDAASNPDGSTNDSVTILISTVNFGNVQVILTKTGDNSINVFITCSKDFPQKDLQQRIKDESKNFNIQSEILADIKDSRVEKQENQKMQVYLNVSSTLNPFLVLMSNFIIKSVIELDNTASLRQIRKEML